MFPPIQGSKMNEGSKPTVIRCQRQQTKGVQPIPTSFFRFPCLSEIDPGPRELAVRVGPFLKLLSGTGEGLEPLTHDLEGR